MEFAYPYLLVTMMWGGLAIYQKYNADSSKRVLYSNLLAIFIFVFFFGLRGFVAYDWVGYYPEFKALPDLQTLFTIPYSKWEWEPGFIIFAAICKSIVPDYFFFQFICVIVNTILLINFLRRYVDNIPLALVLFITMSGCEITINLLRNSIAILLFANAIPYIVEKKPVKYFLVCALAYTFHSSALAYFPMYFILNRQINKYVLLAIFVVANVVYLFHIPVLKSIILLVVDILMPSTKQWIESYLNFDANTGSVLSIGYIERLLTGVLLFGYMDKLRSIRKENNIFINSLVIYLFLFLFLSEFRTISVRCSFLFVFAYWILWIDFIKCFQYRNNKLLFALFIGCYSLLKLYSSNNTAMSDYYNILFENHSFSERLIHFRQHYNDVK